MENPKDESQITANTLNETDLQEECYAESDSYERRETDLDPNSYYEEYLSDEGHEIEPEEEVYEHEEGIGEVISDILDYECGEPISSQHLKIDFNPLVGSDDNDFVTKKCIDFWKLIEADPITQQLMVLPKMMTKSVQNSLISDAQSSSSASSTISVPEHLMTAALNCIEKDERIVNQVFSTKFKMGYCEEGSGDFSLELPQKNDAEKSEDGTEQAMKYKEESYGGPSVFQRKKSLRIEGTDPKLLSHRSSMRASVKRHVSEKRDDVSKMCAELEQWDICHPKSMEAPGHAPVLSQAMMQRRNI